jgi:uncharacterized protein (TIGR03437 family)
MRICLPILLAAIPLVLHGQTQFHQQGAKLVPTGYADFPVVCAVATTSDGNLMIVGGANDAGGTGAMWTFARANGVWTQQGNKVTAQGATKGSYFGGGLAISADGNTAISNGAAGSSLAPSPALWVFTRVNGVWVQQSGNLFANLNGGLPSSALSADGNTIVAGLAFDGLPFGGFPPVYPGALWFFTHNNGVWTQQAKISGSQGDSVGDSVAISGDGNTVFARSLSGIWVMRRINGVWSKQGVLPNPIGEVGNAGRGLPMTISADGSTALLGGVEDDSGIGAAWVYTQTNGSWSQQGKKLVGTGAIGKAFQGSGLALSTDGNIAVIGGSLDDNEAGAVWVFTRNSGTWTQQGNKLVGSGAVALGTSGAAQGNCLALSGDGTTLVEAGGFDSQTNLGSIGAVWAFTQPAATTFTLTASTLNAIAGTFVTFTAAVKVSNPNLAGLPAGTVTFYENGVALPGSALAVGPSGTATYTASFPAGTHNVYASFAPLSTSHAASGASLTLNVSLAATQTALTVSLASAVTLNASVTTGAASPEITGAVQFMDVTTNAALGSSQINKGAASLTLPTAVAASIGGHLLQAVYLGDANYTPSTSSSVFIPILVNAASGSSASFSPGEFVSLFGAQLADSTAQAGPPLPATLGGATVFISDSNGVGRAAQLAYASPSQINLVLPADLPTGQASLILRHGAIGFSLPINVASVAPGIFSADSSGRGLAAAQILRVNADGSQVVANVDSGIVLGDQPTYLVLYGTGIRNRSDLINVTCRINEQSLPVAYAGAQSEFPGLDQLDVLLPQSLVGAGTAKVSLTVDGVTSNTVTLLFR